MSYELVQDAMSGKQYAMVDLLTKITEDITNIVWHYLGTRYSHRIDAEDVVQEVLFQVAKDLPTCEATDWKQFMCWVFFISRNNTYKSVSMIKLGKSSADRTQAIGESWEASSHTQAPDAILIERENLQAVLELAQTISSNARRVCELLGEGNTPNEIATVLGIGVYEVYSVRRSLKDLCNARGIYQTKKSDAWKPAIQQASSTSADAASPKVATDVAANVQADPLKKARMRQWKRFASELEAKTCPVEYRKGVVYLERAIAKLDVSEQSEMTEHIGFAAMQQRLLQSV
jgi:DNA-directed RNA polymerase specialized sigma24 family protein